MKRLSFIFTLLIFSGIIFSFYSCEKENLLINGNIEDELFPENSEMIIDGELFIDGVSQKEVITNFDIEGVDVIDGRLAFIDHDAMMNAIHKLAEYNTESVVAWSEKIGFTSLFTELTRIEEKPLEEIKTELNKGMYKEYFYILDEGILELSKHSTVHSRIYNTQGLIQVGNFVGTISDGLNVWINTNKVSKLIEALQNHYIPEDDKDFVIGDKRAFSNNKDWTQFSTICPILYGGSMTWEDKQYKNPNARRRINVQNQFLDYKTPLDNGNWDLDIEYWIYTVSRKRSWYKYKTNHYLSIDIRTRPVVNEVRANFVITRQNTDTDNNTKYGNIVNHIFTVRDVPHESLIANWEELEEVIPGTLGSGQTGTAASHKGMGSNGYGRFQCN